MKINEVLSEGAIEEGLADFAQSFYGAGKQAKQASAQQAAVTKQVTSAALQKWAKVAQSLQAAGQDVTPEAAVRWFSKFINGQPTSSPTGVKPNDISQWLTKEISNYIAQKELGAATAPVKKYKSGTPVSPTAGNDLSLEPTVSAKATTPPDTAPSSDSLGISIVRATDQGTILRYKNQNYWPNNRGQWAIDGKDAVNFVATPQLQDAMDNAAIPGHTAT